MRGDARRCAANPRRVFAAILPPRLPIICAILLKVPCRFTALKIPLGENLRRNFYLENVTNHQISIPCSPSNSAGLAEKSGNPSSSLLGNRQRPMLDDAVLLIWDCVARSDWGALPGVLITLLVYRLRKADPPQAHASVPVSRSKKSSIAVSEMLVMAVDKLWISPGNPHG